MNILSGAGPAREPETKEDFLINELISCERHTPFEMMVVKILLHILTKLNVSENKS